MGKYVVVKNPDLGIDTVPVYPVVRETSFYVIQHPDHGELSVSCDDCEEIDPAG